VGGGLSGYYGSFNCHQELDMPMLCHSLWVEDHVFNLMNGGQAVGGYVGVPGPESLFDSNQFYLHD
jgi:hypothetical protein